MGLSAAALPARAEEPPEAVRALDTEDAAARASAEEALRALEDRDAVVSGVLRDAEAFDSLGLPARIVLVRLAGEADVAYVNSALRRVVRDSDAPVELRREAVVALGKRAGIADVSALGGALTEFPDEASRALAAVGGRSAEGLLRKHLTDDAHPAIRAALVKLGDDAPLRSLVIALRTDDDARRERIGELLVWATGRELPAEPAAWEAHLRRRALAHQIAHEDLERAQTAAQELAGVLRSRTSATLEPDLIAILEDPAWHFQARSAAALVLGLGDARGAKDALLRASRNLEHGSVRLYAVEALARVGDLSVAVPIADLLVHDEDRDRIAARRNTSGVMNQFFPVDPAMMRTMFRLGCPGAMEPVLEVMAGNYRTRLLRDTVRALRELSDGEDFGYEPDAPKDMRLAAAERARAWWAEARDGIGIEPKADDPGWEAFRGHVAERIAGLGAFKFLHQLRNKKALIIVAEPALPQLVEALAADDLHVRMGAAEVLRGAGLREAGPALAARLAVEENPAARSKLVWALERCGRRDAAGSAPDEVREAVRTALEDRELEVRIAAARTLGVVGDPAVDVAHLQRVRGDGNGPAPTLPTYRVATAGSLLLLGDASGFDDLAQELLCDDVARRADAADFVSRAGHDLQGYDPDASTEARAQAVERLRAVLEKAR
jgi:HEAT repeat protein